MLIKKDFGESEIFEHNSALNYCNVRNFHMWRLDLNPKKKQFLNFFILDGNITKF